MEGLLVFGKAFSFAGGAGAKASASSTSQALQSLERERSQKEQRRAAQRKRLQIFRGSGLATKDARRGIEEGHPRIARVLHSTPSAPKDPRIFLAHRGCPALRSGAHRQRKGTSSSARRRAVRCG